MSLCRSRKLVDSYLRVVCTYASFYGWKYHYKLCKTTASVYVYFKHYSGRWLYCRISDHNKEAFSKDCARGNGKVCQVLCVRRASGLQTVLCLLSFGSDPCVTVRL